MEDSAGELDWKSGTNMLRVGAPSIKHSSFSGLIHCALLVIIVASSHLFASVGAASSSVSVAEGGLQQTGKSSGSLEICQWQSFNGSCPTGSVIIIEHALYGRMRFGRCMGHDYGFLGCSVDIQSYVERQCAGRGRCQLSLPDAYLDHLPKPSCPKDLKSYMEVSYHCLAVEVYDERKCRGQSDLKITSSVGYLSNFITEETNKGSVVCPWIIEGRPGHRFTLTLYDFGIWSKEGDVERLPAKSGLCHIYAQVREASASGQNSIIVCGGEQREQMVYASETNVVRVEITNPKSANSPAYFLLKFEASGCLEYQPSNGVVVSERHPDRVVVRCHSEDSSLSWELRCEGDRWIGKSANCSTDMTSSWFGNLLASSGSISRNIVGSVISAIAVVVAIIILVIGVWAIRRKRREDRRNQRRKQLQDKALASAAVSDPTYMRYKEQYPMLLKADGYAKGRESEYTTTLPKHKQATIVSVPQTAYNRPTDFYCFPGSALRHPGDPDDLYSVGSAGGPDVMSASVRDSSTIEHIYESPKFFRRTMHEDQVNVDCDERTGVEISGGPWTPS